VVAAAAQANAAASTAAAAASEPQQQQQQQQDLRGKDVVMAFYEAYNVRDLQAIASLIADDISYHDLVYEEPHEGREGVMEWLNKVSVYYSVTRQQKCDRLATLGL
jgi:ABC-type microcin C transport system duplicated ATPase subunit YejF